MRRFQRLSLYIMLYSLASLSVLALSALALPATVELNLFSTTPGSCYEVRGTQQFHTPEWQRLSMKSAKTWQLSSSASGLKIRPCNQPDRVRTLTGQVRIRPKATSKGKSRILEIHHWCRSQDYVMSVVASETLPNWHLETFKALSVLIQNRLARNPTSILPDSTTEGLFTGLDRITPTVRKAVEATWGMQLVDKKTHQRINVYYHAACAGHTSSEGIFQGSNSSFNGVSCPFCRQAPLSKTHQGRIPAAAFEKVFGPGTPQVITRDQAERPLRVRWGSGKETSGYTFWLTLGQHFGWDKAPGTRFWISKDKDTYRITAQGGGHGIGLCQWGAEKMASQGKPYEAILQWYYPDALLKQSGN